MAMEQYNPLRKKSPGSTERNPLVRQIFTTHAKSLRDAFMNEASAFLIPVGVSPPSYFTEKKSIP